MTGFILGIAFTLTAQQAWRYRDLFPGWWARLKAMLGKGG